MCREVRVQVHRRGCLQPFYTQFQAELRLGTQKQICLLPSAPHTNCTKKYILLYVSRNLLLFKFHTLGCDILYRFSPDFMHLSIFHV